MTRNRWLASFTVLALVALGGVAYAAGQDGGPKKQPALAPIRKVKVVTEYKKVRVVKTRKPKLRQAKPRKASSAGGGYKPVAVSSPPAAKQKTYSPAPKTESGPSKGYGEDEGREEDYGDDSSQGEEDHQENHQEDRQEDHEEGDD